MEHRIKRGPQSNNQHLVLTHLILREQEEIDSTDHTGSEAFLPKQLSRHNACLHTAEEIHCEEELLPEHNAEAGRISLYQDYLLLASSTTLLKELRMALSSNRKKTVVSTGSRSTTPVGG